MKKKYKQLKMQLKTNKKAVEDTAQKQILNTDQILKSISNLFSKYYLATEAKDELIKLKR